MTDFKVLSNLSAFLQTPKRSEAAPLASSVYECAREKGDGYMIPNSEWHVAAKGVCQPCDRLLAG